MRTTKDLIMELEENAKGRTMAKLYTGFEHTTVSVRSDDPNRLQLLNEAVTLGGEPVCWCRFKAGKVEMGVLPEYEHEDWAHEYLKALRDDIERQSRVPGAE